MKLIQSNRTPRFSEYKFFEVGLTCQQCCHYTKKHDNKTDEIHGTINGLFWEDYIQIFTND